MSLAVYDILFFFSTPLTGVSLRYRKCHGEGGGEGEYGCLAEYVILFLLNTNRMFKY